MEQQAKEINVNDLVPVAAFGVGVIHGQTPTGPASYVVVAPQAEQPSNGIQPSLQPLVMTVELAEQLIAMLNQQVDMIQAGDPFGGKPPTSKLM